MSIESPAEPQSRLSIARDADWSRPPRRLSRFRRVLRRVLILALLLLTGVGTYVVQRWWGGNLATVAQGRIYRSAQLDPEELRRVIADKRIKTVLNLRGPNPGQAWYLAERRATLAAGATHVDIAMSSREWMSRDQLRALIGVLDGCEYPLLIHCWRGAERTGLVSACTELLRPGGSLESARAQFSVRYLFVPVGGGAVMPRHIDQYAGWLRTRRLAHSSARFREWATSGFRPGSPSREEWPYDPYPLVVTCRPTEKK